MNPYASVFFFARARERIFIKMHKIESRCVIQLIGLENTVCGCIHQLGNCTGWGSEGVKLKA